MIMFDLSGTTVHDDTGVRDCRDVEWSASGDGMGQVLASVRELPELIESQF